jgi:hypothetical protein
MSSLHPLKTKLPAATLRVELRGARLADGAGLLECTYRPRRAWDVRKTWHLHLFGSAFRIGSRDWLTVQREEFHVERRELRGTGDAVAFEVPLRAPDRRHARYQLEELRVGDVRFARWFEAAPQLPAGFGLQATKEELRGEVLLDGIDAEPLRGALPLWPALRRIDVRVRRVARRSLRLFDALERHHWDGWRQDPPLSGNGGRSIVVRHVENDVVWRTHEIDASSSSGRHSGIGLEVFWPSGERLELPEARFVGTVDVIGFALRALPARAATLLAESARARAGIPTFTLSTSEWNELEALALDRDAWPVDFRACAAPDGGEHLEVRRESSRGDSRWTEAFLALFGAEPAADDRRCIAAFALHPSAWQGALPE